MYRKNNDVRFIDQPPAYKEYYLSFEGGKQFGSQLTSHRRLYEEFYQRLPEMGPLPPHLQLPSKPRK